MARWSWFCAGIAALSVGCASAGNTAVTTPPASAFETGVARSESRAAEVAARIDFFGISVADARSLVVVVDRSVGRELELVKAELEGALETVPGDARVGVVFFGGGEVSGLDLAPLDETHRRDLSRRIAAATPAPPSSPTAAMERAYAAGARRIILVAARIDRADGEALLSGAGPEIRAGVRIDTVGVAVGETGDQLAALADASGGDAVER